jgi:hypothetical protein
MRYQPRDLDIVWENQDNESLLIDLKKGVYYSFLGGTAQILEYLLSGFSISETREQLKTRFSESKETAFESRLQTVVEILVKDELVVESPSRTPEKIAKKSTEEIKDFPEVERYDDMTEIFEMDPIHDGDLERGWPVQAS